VVAQATSSDKLTFAEIIEKFLVQQNGEVVVDVRTSTPQRWQRELLDQTAPWRAALSPGVYRYIVIHEYNRYHAVQLDQNQKVLSFITVHVVEKPLASSGPAWKKRNQ